MAEPTYVYEGKIERGSGAIRTALLPAESAPVYFGVHGAIAKHYGLNPATMKEPRAATLDYVMAAAAAWLQGTFATALAARNVKTGRGALSSDVRGEVETEDGILVIRRIFVHHRLAASEDVRNVVEEVHRSYAMHCPLYRTLHRCIEFKISYQLVPAVAAGSP
jgi:uncharacterized OsmC-like protein